MTSYPTRTFRRPALAPGILATIALVAGIALIGTDGFIWIRYVVAILAVIVAYFSLQARQWWWLVLLLPIVIAWNPVFPIDWSGIAWTAAQFVGAIAFLVIGVRVKVADPDAGKRR